MNYVTEQIAKAIRAKTFNEQGFSEITNVLIDSRTVGCNEHSLFFALVGLADDGHQYIQGLIAKGVRNFVVSDASCIDQQANYFLVDDTTAALQQFAQFHRTHYTIPIIGITGSNGKTIVKEWLATSLENNEVPVKTIGSFNSQVGVPLSVFQLNELHTIGIFEAGISQVGEMEKLQNIIRPTIGILTNIGGAHDVGFDSKEEKIAEKIKLFTSCEYVICNEKYASILPDNKLFTWGDSSNADVCTVVVNEVLTLTYQGNSQKYRLPFTDHFGLENLMQVLVFHIWNNQSVDHLQKIIDQVRPVAMRLEVKNGIHDSLLIDDTYNNDPEGMKRAVSFLSTQDKGLKRAAIISGYLSNQGDYKELNNELIQVGVESLYLIGKEVEKADFTLPAKSYATVDAFLKAIDTKEISEHAILIKGARKYKFERIVEFLEREFHETVLEVNLSALQHNLNYFRSKLKPETKVMAMVKAYAYGAGATTIARLMQYNQVDYLGVAYVDEGVKLRTNGITTPIMVMNPTDKSIRKFLEFDLEPEVYSFPQLEKLIALLDGQILKIHLKIDTGMHRLGFLPSDCHQLIAVLREHTNLEVASVFTHLAASDTPQEDGFTFHQMQIFEEMTQQLIGELAINPLRHVLNSAGIQRFSDHQFDMVRLGVGLYGVGVDTAEQKQLQHIGVLKTRISQVKSIPKEESVGYARKGRLTKDSKTATIAIGYADGYDRRFSNGVGTVLVNGQKAKVIGNVCMDMTMIDVSLIDAKEGDEVIVFSEELTVSELAQQIGTIPYEILTSISERVKRVFVRE